ncbi:hypothetical protein [Bradyrhizobium symbiodeficiens]|uniref:hypothetical protein n=1 Tax=Bradyrhizobium symbiodeficiens TaxID=1404367 RepID=UPI0011E4D13B|nr:hypothetical protein [Bradyrhizobium symbiodeficiens]
MRGINLVGCILAAGLGGCSLYPIPDDVSPYRTEHIVRHGRCEVRTALFDYMIGKGIVSAHDDSKQLASRIKAAREFEKKLKATKKAPSNDEERNLLELARLSKVGVAYSFDFNITEVNKAGADAGFRLPGLTSVLDVGATGALDLTRNGSRVFGTEDSWDDLIVNTSLCENLAERRPVNVFYPPTGSIGVGRVVETFIDIDEQGGAKDNFVDTLTFTTLASGGANASLKLDPVPNQFRPISATAAIGASRLDIHKLTISLAFPQDIPKAITGVTREDGDLNAPTDRPFARPPIWRARYNLCVQDARTREATFKMLRLTDPLVYCISYADSFAPRYGQPVVTVLRRRAAQPPTQLKSLLENQPAARTRVVPETVIRQPFRPNASPSYVQ